MKQTVLLMMLLCLVMVSMVSGALQPHMPLLEALSPRALEELAGRYAASNMPSSAALYYAMASEGYEMTGENDKVAAMDLAVAQQCEAHANQLMALGKGSDAIEAFNGAVSAYEAIGDDKGALRVSEKAQETYKAFVAARKRK